MRSPSWGALALIALLPTVAGAQADPPPLARYVPKSDVVLYLEHQGTQYSAEAWNNTEAAKLFAETPAGSMFEAMIAQATDQLAAKLPSKKFSGADLAIAVKYAAKHGFVLAGRAKSGATGGLMLVVRGVGSDKEAMGPFARLITSGFPADQAPTPIPGPGGKQVIAVGPKDAPAFVWWVEGGDLIIAAEPKGDYPKLLEEIQAAATSPTSNMTSSPDREELFAVQDGFQPLAAGFMEFGAFLATSPQAKQAMQSSLMGGTFQRIKLRWGVQDNALVTAVTFVAPAPRSGLLALLDQPTFGRDELPRLPAGLKEFRIVSFDAAKTFDNLGTLAKAGGPQGAEAWDQISQGFQDQRGLKLKEDLLAQIGPKAAFYIAPGGPKPAPAPAGNSAAALVGMLANPPRACMVVELKDPKSFEKNVDALIGTLNDGIREVIDSALMPYPVRRLVGRPAPDFQFTVLEPDNGTKTVSKKDLAGKVVLIDFWTTWCGPSRVELPELQKLIKNYEKGNKNLAVVVLSQDQELPRGGVRGLIEKSLADIKVDFQGSKFGSVAMDPQQEVGDAFRVTAYPTILLMDQKGVVRSVHVGYGKDFSKKLGEELDRLLANRPLPDEKRSAPSGPVLAFKKSPGTATPSYILSLPAGILPPSVAPAIVMGKKHIAFGINAKIARDALEVADGGGEAWDPGSDFGPVVNRLPGTMSAVSVTDPRIDLPETLGQLPNAIEAMVAAFQRVEVAMPPTIPGLTTGQEADGEVSPAKGGPGGSPANPAPAGPSSGGSPAMSRPISSSSPGPANFPAPGPAGSSSSSPAPGGQPRPPGAPEEDGGAVTLRFQIADSQRPTPEQVRAHLFPTSRAVSVLPEGLEYRQRQAFLELGSSESFENQVLLNVLKDLIPRIAAAEGAPAPAGAPGSAPSQPGSPSSGYYQGPGGAPPAGPAGSSSSGSRRDRD